MYLDDEVAGKNIAEMEKSGKIAMDHGNNVHNFEQTWVNIDDADFCFCFWVHEVCGIDGSSDEYPCRG